MKKFLPPMNQKGFSLVELMIVVGIIGVLATLALPRFKQFQAKAKMGEAKNILAHVYTLQQSYSLDNNRFLTFGRLGRPANGALTAASCTPDANAQLLGFRIDPCQPGGTTPRFGYTGAVGTNSTFRVDAATGAGNDNAVCPGNGAITFTIDHNNNVGEPAGGVGAACVN